jgi:hypothetical protein
VVIKRTIQKDGLIVGSTLVNSDPLDFESGLIGDTYEPKDMLISAGSYSGLLRYWSGHNFVSGPFGTIGKTGDFLLEVKGAQSPSGAAKTNVLLHGGNKAIHSTGCVLLGAVGKDPTGVPVLENEHPLRKLRLAFYGSDAPSSTPNREIVIDVLNPP